MYIYKFVCIYVHSYIHAYTYIRISIYLYVCKNPNVRVAITKDKFVLYLKKKIQRLTSHPHHHPRIPHTLPHKPPPLSMQANVSESSRRSSSPSKKASTSRGLSSPTTTTHTLFFFFFWLSCQESSTEGGVAGEWGGAEGGMVAADKGPELQPSSAPREMERCLAARAPHGRDGGRKRGAVEQRRRCCEEDGGGGVRVCNGRGPLVANSVCVCVLACVCVF